MTDRAQSIAAFIRQHARTNRGDLLRAILDQWPDLSGDELQRAIDLRTTAGVCWCWRSSPHRPIRKPRYGNDGTQHPTIVVGVPMPAALSRKESASD